MVLTTHTLTSSFESSKNLEREHSHRQQRTRSTHALLHSSAKVFEVDISTRGVSCVRAFLFPVFLFSWFLASFLSVCLWWLPLLLQGIHLWRNAFFFFFAVCVRVCVRVCTQTSWVLGTQLEHRTSPPSPKGRRRNSSTASTAFPLVYRHAVRVRRSCWRWGRFDVNQGQQQQQRSR